MPDFASNTENINNPTEAELEKGFAGCGGDGMQMTSANINGALNAISQSSSDVSEDLQNQIDNLPDEEFISAMALDGDELVASYNSTRTPLRVDLSKYLTDTATLEIIGDELVLTNEDNTESRIPLVELLKLSPDMGNLLEMRDNGIYYGIDAEPNLQNLYVDGEHGNDDVSLDDGGGTEAQPFRTLQHALNLTPIDKSNTIYLRAIYDNGDKQRYETNKLTPVRGTATRTIKTYDDSLQDVYDCWSTHTSNFYRFATLERIRPVISFNYRETSFYYDLFESFDTDDTAKLILKNVELSDNTPPNPSKTRLLTSFFRGSGSIQTLGVWFNADLVAVYAGDESSDTNLIFSDTNMVDDNGLVAAGTLTNKIDVGGGRLNLSVSESPTIIAQSIQDLCGTDITYIGGNMEQHLQSPNFVRGLNRDASGTLTNVTGNITI